MDNYTAIVLYAVIIYYFNYKLDSIKKLIEIDKERHWARIEAGYKKLEREKFKEIKDSQPKGKFPTITTIPPIFPKCKPPKEE